MSGALGTPFSGLCCKCPRRRAPVTVVSAIADQAIAARSSPSRWLRRTIRLEVAIAAALTAQAAAQAPAPAPPEPSPREPIRTVRAVQQLQNAEARQGLPVVLRGIVTHSNPEWSLLFLQDATGGIYCSTARLPELPGFQEECEVSGVTREGSFLPIFTALKVTTFGKRNLPDPIKAEIVDLWTGKYDGRHVQVRGTAAWARRAEDGTNHFVLKLYTRERSLDVKVRGDLALPAEEYRFAEVEATGVCGVNGDGRGHVVDVGVLLQRTEDLRILERGPAVLARAPSVPLSTLAESPVAQPLIVRTRGRVRLGEAPAVVIGEGRSALPILLATPRKLIPQELVEVSGFPESRRGRGILREAVVTSSTGGPPEPCLDLEPQDLWHDEYFGCVVRVNATLVHTVHGRRGQSTEDLLILEGRESTFEVAFDYPAGHADAMSLPQGVQLELTGVLWHEILEGQGARPRLIVRGPHDWKNLGPARWSRRGTATALAILGTVLLGGFVILGWSRWRLALAAKIIRRSEQEVEALNRELERRILQRTEELNAANLRLLREVEERAAKERELALAERFARETMDSLAASVCVLDGAGKIIFVNRAWRRSAENATPVLPDHGLGMSYLEICEHATGEGQEDALRFGKGLRDLLDGIQEEVSAEYSCGTGDEQGWYFASARRFVGSGPLRIVVSHENITAQRRAREALQAAESRFRSAVEHSFECLSLTNGDGICIYTSPSARRISGWTPEELTGKPLLDFVLPEDLPRLAFHRECLLAAPGNHATVSFRFRHKDGSWRWIETTDTNRLDDPNLRAVVSNARDVTDQRRMEDSLRDLSVHILKLQDQERGRLARELHDGTVQSLSLVAHSLRSLQQISELEPTRRMQLLVDCLGLTEQAMQEIRTLSYLLHPPVLEIVGLGGALRDFAEGFSRRSEIKVTFTNRANVGRLPPEVENALLRVAQEGLNNIRKHSGSPTAQILLDEEEAALVLEIRDQGRGVRSEVLEALDTGAGPLGVGLLGMRERLAQLGGTLSIDSRPGATSVRARVPLDGKSSSARSGGSDPTPVESN